MDRDRPGYFRYWGKAAPKEDQSENHHLLVYHSLDVAAVGQVLLSKHKTLRQRLADLAGFTDEMEFKQWIVFFLTLHDLGKFAESFQNLKPDLLAALQHGTSERQYGIRHDSLGYMLWRAELKEWFSEIGILPRVTSPRRSSSTQAVDYWIQAVTGHHGQPPEGVSSHRLLTDDFDQKDLKAVKEFIEQICTELLGKDRSFPDLDTDRQRQASWWLAGFAVLCDWMGSNKDYFPYQTTPRELAEYWKASALRNAERIVADTALLPSTPSGDLQLDELIKGQGTEIIEPTPLQRLASNHKLTATPQLFILEDVTGSGKTEAAILLAHRLMVATKAEGIYFGLPTMATANAMYARIADVHRSLFAANETPSVVLAHASRMLIKGFKDSILPLPTRQESDYGRDGCTPASVHCNGWLADNPKKAMLADIGIGTIDQALLAVLPSRHQSLRLLGLSGKVLIVDEVHACDAYMHTLLCALLKVHAAAGDSAILLSATLPLRQRQALINAFSEGRGAPKRLLEKYGYDDYPLFTHSSECRLDEEVIGTRDSVKREVRVKFLHELGDVVRTISEHIEAGRCVCWIRNTVIEAREAWELLSGEYPGWNVDLFHARYAMADRLEIEERVVNRFGSKSTHARREGQVLIATQVVEQSLDIDFDVMITDLAPIDLIIQRAGRLCRHTRDRKGNRIEGDDQRGMPVIHIHAPSFDKEPTPDWYAGFAPRSNKVYGNHAHLWLTCKVLLEQDLFRMPDDARRLIENVYGEESEDAIPDGLMKNFRDAVGDSSADAGLGRLNALDLDTGYTKESANLWWDESKTPTRLGEETTTVYLARWKDGRLSPWIKTDHFPWRQSGVQIRAYWINQEAENSEIPKDVIEHCREQLPAKGKWGVLLPLVEHENGLWQGIAINGSGEIIRVYYDRQRGLRFSHEQGNV